MMIQASANSTAYSGYASAAVARSGGAPPPSVGLRAQRSQDSVPASSERAQAAPSILGAEEGLTSEESALVERLSRVDKAVRAHEQAHLSAGAGLVRGGAAFEYETGPDGKRYAVAGEVSIDTSPGRTPKETIPKAQQIRAAALAPADPSTQDQRVAAQATRMENEARIELTAQQRSVRSSSGAEASDAVAAGNYRLVQQAGAGGAPVGGMLDTFA